MVEKETLMASLIIMIIIFVLVGGYFGYTYFSKTYKENNQHKKDLAWQNASNYTLFQVIYGISQLQANSTDGVAHLNIPIPALTSKSPNQVIVIDALIKQVVNATK